MVANKSHLLFLNLMSLLAVCSLREKCPFSEFLWSVFSRIRTEYSVLMRENADQKNSEYGHFSRSVSYKVCSKVIMFNSNSFHMGEIGYFFKKLKLKLLFFVNLEIALIFNFM